MPPSPDAPIVIDPQAMRHGAKAAVGLLKLLGNEDRLLLLCQLSQGECCVGDLEQRLGIRQPTLSQQLGALRADGVAHEPEYPRPPQQHPRTAASPQCTDVGHRPGRMRRER